MAKEFQISSYSSNVREAAIKYLLGDVDFYRAQNHADARICPECKNQVKEGISHNGFVYDEECICQYILNNFEEEAITS